MLHGVAYKQESAPLDTCTVCTLSLKAERQGDGSRFTEYIPSMKGERKETEHNNKQGQDKLERCLQSEYKNTFQRTRFKMFDGYSDYVHMICTKIYL